jgi:hypothetical protein
VLKHYIEGSEEPNKLHWSLSAEDYVKRAVKDIETELNKAGKFLPTKVTTLPPRTGPIQGARGSASVVQRWPDRSIRVVY